MARVTSTIGKDNYITNITSPNGNVILADEPEDVGGQNKGLAPTELLAASLASCTCITLRMYADRKEWPLDNVEVSVDYEFDRTTRTTNIVKSIKLHGDLDEKQKERLNIIAEKCPVSLSLTNPINMTTMHL